jgi:ribosomal protein L23
MIQIKLCLSVVFITLLTSNVSSEAQTFSKDKVNVAEYYIADSFKAIAAKGFNWEHIFENHSAAGKVAKQRLKNDPNYIYSIYQNMTDSQIQACVQRTWKVKEKINIQSAAPGKSRRIQYRGYDAETKYTIEFWQNEDSGFIETAYPIKAKSP